MSVTEGLNTYSGISTKNNHRKQVKKQTYNRRRYRERKTLKRVSLAERTKDFYQDRSRKTGTAFQPVREGKDKPVLQERKIKGGNACNYTESCLRTS